MKNLTLHPIFEWNKKIMLNPCLLNINRHTKKKIHVRKRKPRERKCSGTTTRNA